jgi:hypothetical protein
VRKLLPAFALLWTCGVTQAAFAQQAGPGFQVNRYEPTAAGEWSLLVEHPWYSSTRYFAAGITLNYAHNPLTYGLRFQDGSYKQTGSIIGNQLIGHIDVAGSFLDRILLTLSMPITMYESGDSVYGVSPATGAAVGDPRIGARVRLLGQPYRGAASLSLGADVWIPINSFGSPPPFPAQTGETGVRILPKLIAGGLWTHSLHVVGDGGLLLSTDSSRCRSCSRQTATRSGPSFSSGRRWPMPIQGLGLGHRS